MNREESIEATKKGFEASFKEESLYNRQTKDDIHLKQIMKLLQIEENNRILDLGTGSGYVAFTISNSWKTAEITGLDIVKETLGRNREKAAQEQLNNIHFVDYDGITFPFEDNSFDRIVARYTLHHFPDIQHSFQEISRVLKKNGRFVIADPTPNDNDTTRFVDDYMKMKPDGHIKYYTKEEWKCLGERAGLTMVERLQTTITFPRLRETAFEYEEILKHHDGDVIAGYQVKESEDGVYLYITQKVWNVAFVKR